VQAPRKAGAQVRVSIQFSSKYIPPDLYPTQDTINRSGKQAFFGKKCGDRAVAGFPRTSAGGSQALRLKNIPEERRFILSRNFHLVFHVLIWYTSIVVDFGGLAITQAGI
jgi:hypothetical protein